MIVAVSACSSDAEDPQGAPFPVPSSPTGVSEELRDELVAMMEQDQAERTGEAPGPWDDVACAERLHEVVDEHG